MPPNPDELTIILADKDGRVSLELLQESLENALKMLKSVQEEMLSSDMQVRWDVVRVKMQSPLELTLRPEVIEPGTRKKNRKLREKLVVTTLKGVTGIEKGTALPEFFGDRAVNGFRQMLKAVKKEGGQLSFESTRESRIALTEAASQHLEELDFRTRDYIDYGTIEGKLDVISVHDKPSCAVWETLTNIRVECSLSEDQLVEATRHLGRRVAIAGRIHYYNHAPRRLEVAEPIRVLRDVSELPQIGDIEPIDITGGLSSEEFIRRQRNG